MPLESDIYSFIVRIWCETRNEPNDQSVWRGSIDQVGNNQRLYFHDLDGITRFIQEQIGLQTKKRRFTWKSLLARIKHEKPKHHGGSVNQPTIGSGA
jgi:hypothetical protein